MSSMTSITKSGSPQTRLPIRKIPGDYGLPFLGPIWDRLNFLYFEGEEAFLRTRIDKHNSTVFRTNMPPGPFIATDPRVVILLDLASFPVLFDVSLVEKKDVLAGTYVPSLTFTGGQRVLAYLDPSEPQHATLKHLLFSLLARRRHRFVPDFTTTYSTLFSDLEAQLSASGKASFSSLNSYATFDFLTRAYFGSSPSDIGSDLDFPEIVKTWFLPQVSPKRAFGLLPSILEDLLLHTFPLPAALFKPSYKKLYDFFFQQGTWFLDEAEKLGLTREEACHSLTFSMSVNGYGACNAFFPLLVKWVGSAGPGLHKKLAHEIRTAVAGAGEELTLSLTEKLPLAKSVVLEALRMEPPVPYQFARAKQDMVIESHEWAYEVKKGEMLCGSQPIAARDPKVFDRADEFVGERFLGEEGEKLLKYVVWSNGRQTDDTTVGNKQCAAKDFVMTVSVLLLVEIFRRYDTFVATVEKGKLESAVVITSVTKAAAT